MNGGGYGRGYENDYDRTGRRAGCLTVGIIAVIIAVFIGIFSSIAGGMGNSDIPKNTVNREAITPAAAYDYDCIEDEEGWFDDADSAAKDLKSFYNETGVQPYILIHSYDETLTTDDEKLVYAEQYFNENVDNETAFLYVYFSEDNDTDVGYMCYISGKQAEIVMDEDAIDIFWAYIDQYWYSDLSTDDMFVSAFDDTAERIMTRQTTAADVGKYAVIGIIVLGGIALVIYGFKQKAKRDAEKAKETEEILNADINKMAEDIASKYEDKDEAIDTIYAEKEYAGEKTPELATSAGTAVKQTPSEAGHMIRPDAADSYIPTESNTDQNNQ